MALLKLVFLGGQLVNSFFQGVQPFKRKHKGFSSKFCSDLRNASSLELTKYYCVYSHCSAVTMPIELSSYPTWSTSETVASVQLPLNSVLICLVEVQSRDFVMSVQLLYHHIM